MPHAPVAVPPARPPILNPLQSIVTLLASTRIASPVVMAVERSLLRHQTPWVSMTAGSEVMVPAQLS